MHRRLFRLLLLPTIAFVVGLVACDAVTRVQGTVVDQAGNPISGAVVRLTLVATGRSRQMTTEQDGKFSVELMHGALPGRFDLVVSKSGYEAKHKEIQAKTTQTVTVTLSPRVDERKEDFSINRRLERALNAGLRSRPCDLNHIGRVFTVAECAYASPILATSRSRSLD